jgi:hypothetical protein
VHCETHKQKPYLRQMPSDEIVCHHHFMSFDLIHLLAAQGRNTHNLLSGNLSWYFQR